MSNMYMGGWTYALIKLYLQEQMEGQIWPMDSCLQIIGVHSLLESTWISLPEHTWGTTVLSLYFCILHPSPFLFPVQMC